MNKKFFVFLILSYFSAFIFENVPRFVIKEVIGWPMEGYLWEIPGWPWIILVWYTLIFVAAYAIYTRKGIKWVLIYGVILGWLAEAFIFKKMNVISFFLFPFFYGGMFYLPFWALKKLNFLSQSN